MNSFKRKNVTVLLSIIALVCFCFGMFLFSSQREISAYAAQNNVTENLEVVYATYSFTKLNSSECSVKISNKAEATIAEIPSKGTINGVEYDVVEVASNGFMSSPNLVRVTLPLTIRKINSFAFYNCPKLKTVHLINVTEVGSNAFSSCKELERITIPESVEILGTNIFNQDNTQVNVRAESAGASWATSWNNGNENQAVTYLYKENDPLNLLPIYERNTRSTSSEIIGYSVAGGQAYAENFYKEEGKTIFIPAINPEDNKPILEIAEYQFFESNFDKLIIEFSAEPINIQSAAFIMAQGNSITINRPVTFNSEYYNYGLSENVFLASNLEKIIFPDSISGINFGMFAMCENLKDIYFLQPENGTDAFQASIIDKQIPTGKVSLPTTDNFTFILSEAFRETQQLKELHIPHNVEWVESDIVNGWGGDTVYVDHAKGALPKNWHEQWADGNNGEIIYERAKIVLDAAGNAISGGEYISNYGRIAVNSDIKLLELVGVSGVVYHWINIEIEDRNTDFDLSLKNVIINPYGALNAIRMDSKETLNLNTYGHVELYGAEGEMYYNASKNGCAAISCGKLIIHSADDLLIKGGDGSHGNLGADSKTGKGGDGGRGGDAGCAVYVSENELTILCPNVTLQAGSAGMGGHGGNGGYEGGKGGKGGNGSSAVVGSNVVVIDDRYNNTFIDSSDGADGNDGFLLPQFPPVHPWD